jgi:hypothetical protein
VWSQAKQRAFSVRAEGFEDLMRIGALELGRRRMNAIVTASTA